MVWKVLGRLGHVLNLVITNNIKIFVVIGIHDPAWPVIAAFPKKVRRVEKSLSIVISEKKFDIELYLTYLEVEKWLFFGGNYKVT